MNYIVVILFFTLSLWAKLEPYSLTPHTTQPLSYMKIKILDTKLLKFYRKDGRKVSELSGLAYCKDGLYALSDNGYLYDFKLDISDDKINLLELEKSIRLRDKKGAVLKGKAKDAEGLSLYGKQLLISFERQHRIAVYSKGGIELRQIKLNKKLRDKKKYINENKGLESVAYNRKYGVITIPENVLKNHNKKYHTLYGRKIEWKFRAKGEITDLEFIDDETALILLRKYSMFGNRFTSLVRVHLDRCNKKRVCQSDLLAKFDSKNGWNIDNFEGLCKVAHNRYLMVSDDNESLFQKTLLVLFEIID